MHPLHVRQGAAAAVGLFFKKRNLGTPKTTCPNRSIYKTTVAKQQMAFLLHRIHFTGGWHLRFAFIYVQNVGGDFG
jgi:hypothetical protein